jgi:RES domain-containing protein
VIRLFRLQQKRFARRPEDAYSGVGASLNKGRWHRVGDEVVYTSSSRSLAAMEILTQVDPEEMPEYVCVPADLPKGVYEARRVVEVGDLPDNWRSYPAPEGLARIGSRWTREGNGLLLDVPSAVIPEERNVLVNPRHPDFGTITFGHIEPFSFDPRIMAKLRGNE